MSVELERERLQEVHVIRQDFLVGEVEGVRDYGVDVIIAQEEICNGRL